MTYFIRNGNDYKVTETSSLDISEVLPAGNYIVNIDQYGNYFLSCVEPFVRIGKIYGDSVKNADRILNTYKNRESSTGVLLTGEKGSGKTMLAKNIAIKGAEEGMPCIIVNSPFHGDTFNKFIQNIKQPSIIFFDEFEKVYPSDKQTHILTLLDGVFPSKKLFVMTCNDKWRIDAHMRNRPGRLFYLIDFTGLDVNFIREYCEDVLINKTYIDQICKLSTMFSIFNFDMLKALVEEMNRYDESPSEAFKLINAKPENSDNILYDIKFFIDGVDVTNQTDSDHWHGNPLSSWISVEFSPNNDDDEESKTYSFSNTDLIKVDASNGTFEYRKNNTSVILTRRKIPKFDIFGVL